jgi:hypothetical protein
MAAFYLFTEEQTGQFGAQLGKISQSGRTRGVQSEKCGSVNFLRVLAKYRLLFSVFLPKS